ncbi:MAG: hypothetical protein JWP10_1158 [Nocardioidaceae bacterium]|nr:hypothetical protein [Nocardioidaceae bacterium]
MNMAQIAALLRQVSDLMDAVRACDLHALAGVEIAEAIGLNQTVHTKIQATALDLTLVADHKRVAQREGAGTTQSLIAQTTGISMREAGKELKLAQALQSVPQTRQAMSAGDLSKDKAQVIARAMNTLPGFVRPEERTTIEADLLTQAKAHSVEDLRRAAKRATEVIDTRLADKLEGQMLRHEEQNAFHQSTFWMSEPDDTGMVEGRFTIPVLHAAILKNALEAFTSPRHNSMVGIDETGIDYPKRLGRGFCDLLMHLPTDRFPRHGGLAATILLTLDYDQLVNELANGAGKGAGTILSTSDRVSAQEIRHIACGAGILPAVLDANPLPLEMGRDRRTFDDTARKAMALRDQGCAFPGCQTPVGWTEAHHINPWAVDGLTNVQHGVLLCPNHHRLIEKGDWTVHIATDGHPEFTPPPWVDPHQQPRRNNHWKPQRTPNGQRKPPPQDNKKTPP